MTESATCSCCVGIEGMAVVAGFFQGYQEWKGEGCIMGVSAL
jgi:hypothetical protein